MRSRPTLNTLCTGYEGKDRMQVNLDKVTIVLKGPKFPGNVGSAAPCAHHMGIGQRRETGAFVAVRWEKR